MPGSAYGRATPDLRPNPASSILIAAENRPDCRWISRKPTSKSVPAIPSIIALPLTRKERASLRVAALPPRKKVRGALDPPCAPRPTGDVGARGAPTDRPALAARRRTRGLVWVFRFWRVRQIDPGEARQIPPLTNPIQYSGRYLSTGNAWLAGDGLPSREAPISRRYGCNPPCRATVGDHRHCGGRQTHGRRPGRQRACAGLPSREAPISRRYGCNPPCRATVGDHRHCGGRQTHGRRPG